MKFRHEVLTLSTDIKKQLPAGGIYPVQELLLFYHDMSRVMYFSGFRRTRTGRGQGAHMNCKAVHIAAFTLFAGLPLPCFRARNRLYKRVCDQ